MRDVESYFGNAMEKLSMFKDRIEEVQKFIHMF